VEVTELGELGGTNPDCIALEQESDAPLAAEHRQHLPDQLIDSGDGSEGLQRRPVGWMLPGYGGDLREALAGTRGNAGAHGNSTVGDAALYGLRR
jgi:hypothetical protein